MGLFCLDMTDDPKEIAEAAIGNLKIFIEYADTPNSMNHLARLASGQAERAARVMEGVCPEIKRHEYVRHRTDEWVGRIVFTHQHINSSAVQLVVEPDTRDSLHVLSVDDVEMIDINTYFDELRRRR